MTAMNEAPEDDLSDDDSVDGNEDGGSDDLSAGASERDDEGNSVDEGDSDVSSDTNDPPAPQVLPGSGRSANIGHTR